MSDEHDDEKPGTGDNESSRRAFLRAAAVTGVGGAAALASGTAHAGGAKPTTKRSATPVMRDYKAHLTTVQQALTQEELSKDIKLKVAEALLQDLDNIEIQWIQGEIPAARRIIQIKG